MIDGAWNHHPSLVLRNELLVMPGGKIKKPSVLQHRGL